MSYKGSSSLWSPALEDLPSAPYPTPIPRRTFLPNHHLFLFLTLCPSNSIHCPQSETRTWIFQQVTFCQVPMGSDLNLDYLDWIHEQHPAPGGELTPAVSAEHSPTRTLQVSISSIRQIYCKHHGKTIKPLHFTSM